MSETTIAVILGVVEGLTEFLPISSTGHMILVGNMLGFEGEKASVFEVFIQLGAILSVLILYRDKFIRMLDFKFPSILSPELTIYHVAVGIVPVMGIGFFLHKSIKTFLFSPLTVIIGLVAGAVLMLVAERLNERPRTVDVDKMTLTQAFWVGLFQCFSLWPGFSRSGSTIAGGLFFGMSRKAAAEFSFIIAVPVMLIAGTYDLYKIWNKLTLDDLSMIAVGFVVSFVIAYLSIIWFLHFLNRCTLAGFAYYRFIVAAASYWYFFLK
jgi:undecaprenyl-diphosphatase